MVLKHSGGIDVRSVKLFVWKLQGTFRQGEGVRSAVVICGLMTRRVLSVTSMDEGNQLIFETFLLFGEVSQQSI